MFSGVTLGNVHRALCPTEGHFYSCSKEQTGQGLSENDRSGRLGPPLRACLEARGPRLIPPEADTQKGGS